MKQKISELLDDELSDLEHYQLMRTLEKDSELRGVWERYHLMRAAMRKELDVMVSPLLADRIALSVGAERPGANSAGYPPAARWSRFTSIGAGLAIAASVAAVAIFALQPLSPITPPASPVALQTVPPSVAVADAAKPTKPVRLGTLNTYLVEHSQFTPNAGMNGMMPYVRIVGYGNDKPQSDDK